MRLLKILNEKAAFSYRKSCALQWWQNIAKITSGGMSERGFAIINKTNIKSNFCLLRTVLTACM